MAAQADERLMISERIAPGMLPRVLNSFDMTVIFVAIVLFIVNASAIQQAHQAAYTYWILGFLAFLINCLSLPFPFAFSLFRVFALTSVFAGPFRAPVPSRR